LKKILDTSVLGQRGVNLIEKIVPNAILLNALNQIKYELLHTIGSTGRFDSAHSHHSNENCA